MTAFNVNCFVIGAGSGGVRAARVSHGRGRGVMVAEEFHISGDLRYRGLRTEEVLCLCLAFTAREFEAAGGLQLGRLRKNPNSTGASWWPRRRNGPPVSICRSRSSPKPMSEWLGGAEIEGANADSLFSLRRSAAAHILVATGGGPARNFAAIPGARTRDFLQRNFRSSRFSATAGHRRQRLYRAGVRQHFRAARVWRLRLACSAPIKFYAASTILCATD